MVKQAKSQPKKSVGAGSRTRPLSKKLAKEKAKKAAAAQAPIPSSFKLLGEVFSALRREWKVLGGIVLVYLALNLIFASGLLSNFSASISTARQSHHFSDALNGYGSLLGGSSGGAQSTSLAQSVLLVLESLVIIWALRHLLAGERIWVKQAYYQSMTPLVPFILVLAMILVQLLPITLGAAVLAIILSSAFGAGSLLSIIFILILAGLAAWSIYMISGSIFGLYIVTLPDMQPRQALRSAKNLVHFRRWPLLRRLLFLPFFLVVAMGLITVPLILILPFLVVPLFFLLVMVGILFVHTYLYCLYRGLIA